MPRPSHTFYFVLLLTAFSLVISICVLVNLRTVPSTIIADEAKASSLNQKSLTQYPPAAVLAQEIQEPVGEPEIGQVLMIAPAGTSLTPGEKNWLAEGKIAGFFFLGKNIQNQNQLQAFIQEIDQAATPSGHQPLLAVDQEGGPVSRIPWVNRQNQESLTSSEAAYDVGFVRGQQLKSLGFDLILAPTVEVISTPSAFIAKQHRNFADSSLEIRRALIQGYQAAGMIPVVKHFPGGLGRVETDPHYQMPEVLIGIDELIEDLFPFVDAIDLPVPALMVTHLRYPFIDSEPVSKSNLFMNQILRDQLNYSGLVVIDDLSMGAVTENFEVGDYAIASLEAGGDLLLISDQDDYRVVEQRLREQFFQDVTFQTQVQATATRVRDLKRLNLAR